MRGAAADTSPVNEQLRTPRAGDLLRLTSLRAIAALLIFVFHLGKWHVVGIGPFELADSAVTFFFILSGFVLGWSAVPGAPVRRFWVNRFARIYPAHLVVLVISAVVPVVAVSRSWVSALASLFLLQAWWPLGGSISYGMNGVAWALSCQAAFYAAFPLIIGVLLRLSSSRRWIVAGVILLADIAMTAVAVHIGRSGGDPLFQWPPARFGEFVLGVVAALEIRRGWRLAPSAALGMVAASVIATVLLPTRAPLDTLYLLPLNFAVILLAAEADIRARRGVLASRVLVYAGQLSFCFYLVHELVIVNLLPPLGGGVGTALLDLVVACAGAAVLHHGVEVPCQRLIRAATRSRTRRADA